MPSYGKRWDLQTSGGGESKRIFPPQSADSAGFMENDGAMAEAALTLDEVLRVRFQSPPQCMPAGGVPVREQGRG